VLSQAGFTEGTALDLRERSRHGAPDRKIVGGQHFAPAPQEDRDAVRAPQAHSQARPFTVTSPNGARDEFTLAATAQKSPQDGQADPDACPEACI
jgi:hypothetical protein